MKASGVVILCFFLSLRWSASAAPPSPDEIRSSYLSHGVKAQFYRWFLAYEVPEPNLERQLELLDEKVTITSPLGKATGHAAYQGAIEALPRDWKNAHTISDISVVSGDGDHLSLSAVVDYANVGRLPEGKPYTSRLQYSGTYIAHTDHCCLPILSSLTISPSATGQTPSSGEYRDTYALNRCLSLLHYWLHLIEHPQRTAKPFRAILADQFSLNFTSGEITTFEAFEKWIAGPASSVSASSHTLSDVTVTTLSKAHHYKLNVTLDWHAILPDGNELSTQTKHTWKIVDDPSERFARVAEINVAILKPFAPITRPQEK